MHLGVVGVVKLLVGQKGRELFSSAPSLPIFMLVTLLVVAGRKQRKLLLLLHLLLINMQSVC
jgi:hypothetical protein